MHDWIDKHKAAELLNCHPNSLPRYRKNEKIGWVEGVHWSRVNQKIVYNRQLLADWLANRHDLDAHLRAIENYQASLLSNQRKRRVG